MLAAGYDRAAQRWIAATRRMDGEPADRCWAMLVLASPDPRGLDLSTSRINAFIGRDKSPDKVRSALLVAGLAGLGRITADGADSLSRRNELGLGRQSVWTRMIDAAAGRDQPASVLILAGTGLQTADFDRRPRRPYVSHHRRPDPHPPGLCRADDRGRGPVPDVTADDQALVDRFLDMMAAEAGASRHTLAAYRNDLERSAEALGGAVGTADAAAVGRLGEQWARSRRRHRRAALGGAPALLRLPGRRRAAPGRPVGAPCRGRGFERPLPRILETGEVARDVRAGRGPGRERRPVSALRNLALLELLYGSGLRASELVTLPRGALRKGQPFLILRGKGDKERLVPISSRAEAAVERWLEQVPADSLWLFPSGKSHLSRVRLFQIVRQMAADAGISPERVSPHVLRHAFATHLLVGRSRPARAPVAAGPCRHRHHPNLHPCRQRAAGRAGQFAPPARDAFSLTR